MFSSLTTKLAMKKMGISSDTFNFSALTSPTWQSEPADGQQQAKKARRPHSDLPPGTLPGLDDDDLDEKSGWPAWMTVKSLPLTVQPWLSPPPPPIPVAACPNVGDVAPVDRDRKLTLGGGRKVVVVFLRCVGCACTYLPSSPSRDPSASARDDARLTTPRRDSRPKDLPRLTDAREPARQQRHVHRRVALVAGGDAQVGGPAGRGVERTGHHG